MKSNRFKFYLGILSAATLSLSACGPIVELPGEGPAPSVFTLSDASPTTDLSLNLPAKLFIEDLGSDTLLATNRIAIRLGPTEVQYLPQARWSDEPQRLFRERLQAALEGIEGLTALGAKALEVPTDYRLKLQLRAFNAKETSSGLIADVRLSAILVATQGSEIMATRRFAASRDIASSDTQDVVTALDAAHADVIADISSWLIEAISEVN
ncbi:MAG: ABC-type transport auxiliary lipoprotein family protein [Sphingomonadales bacterium]|jgi:cholesterol transport system auxiliary component